MTTAIDYERLAEDYARHRAVQPKVLGALLDAGIDGSSRVLEVGCGTGNYLIAVRRATGCHAIGVDPAAAMLATARARDGAIDWRAGPGEALPLTDGSVDLIYSVDVIHHVKDRPAFFREAMRVLAPGGRLVTATDSHEDIGRRRPLTSHFPETFAAELARYPAAETLEAEMAAAGFRASSRQQVELRYPLSDIAAYRARAFSSLHLISASAFRAGIERLEADLARGPIDALSLYTLIWGTKPPAG